MSEREKTKYRPLTIKEGGIYTPVVLTTIDIPPTDEIDVADQEYILLALHLGRFKPNDFDFPEETIELDDILEAYQSYNQERKMKRYIEGKMKDGIPEEQASDEWKREGCIEDFEQIDSVAYMVHLWLKYPKYENQQFNLRGYAKI